MRCQELPVGLQAHICPIQIQFLMLGLEESRGDRLTRRSVQSWANHHAVLDGKKVPGDGMMPRREGLLCGAAHAGFRLRLEFFRREGR